MSSFWVVSRSLAVHSSQPTLAPPDPSTIVPNEERTVAILALADVAMALAAVYNINSDPLPIFVAG
jgi:hypothetical protein